MRSFFSRLPAALLHVLLLGLLRALAQVPLPHVADGGAAALARRHHGRAEHQLHHHQALRRVPVHHQRDPVKTESFARGVPGDRPPPVGGPGLT